MVQFLNKWTGEIHELPDNTPEEITQAWLALSETIKACERAKDKLKPKVEAMMDSRSTYEVGAHQFRISNIQRMTYDKSVMRDVLDADTFDVLLVPDKPAIDRYLKENLGELGEASTVLRNSMIPQGNPYQVIRLEKL